MILRRILPILVTLLTASAVVAAVAYYPASPVTPRVAGVLSQLGASYVGRPAPDFELSGVGDPTATSLRDYRGQWVFLNFWASWCEPCREEMPSMRRLAERLEEREFRMVGVSLDSDVPEMQQFLADVGITGEFLDILHDSTGAVSSRYGSQLLPETWLIDPDGVIVARFQGGYDWTQENVLTLLDLLTREGWRG